jgi:lycopene cyclase domain-containing protein
LQTNNASKTIFLVYAVVFGILGITFYHRAYTASTFIFMAVFIELILFFLPQNKRFNLTAFLVAYAIILIPFLIVNGFLTALPVVLYNNRENLGIRIYTIPIEDVVYGMLLVMMNIVIFEKLESIRRARQIAMSSSPSHT